MDTEAPVTDEVKLEKLLQDKLREGLATQGPMAYNIAGRYEPTPEEKKDNTIAHLCGILGQFSHTGYVGAQLCEEVVTPLYQEMLGLVKAKLKEIL